MMRSAPRPALRSRRAYGAFRVLAAWLAFALVIGYPAAAWHAIGHLGSTSLQHLHADEAAQPSSSSHCDLDAAYAELAAYAAVPHALDVCLVSGAMPVAIFAQGDRHAAPARFYLARAPPARSHLA